ncbi:MAG: hypothetical protein J5965_27070 [Aeriscardovia sp.]|nr:hypothetical protein [Aeriscardovia sp.]
MKEFDRVKDGDEYQYIVDGELAMCGDDMLMGVIKDWENRYNEVEQITNMLVFDDDDRVFDNHNVVYTKDGKHLLNCLNTFNEAEYTVREGVTTICDDAFSWRANQEQRITLYIPRSVKVIGENIFGDGGGRIIVNQ